MTARLINTRARVLLRTGIIPLSVLAGCFAGRVHAQEPVIHRQDTVQPVDVGDVLHKLFKKKQDAKPKKQSGVAFLPSFGYNPSFGFTIGAKVSAGKQFGDPGNTSYSVFGLEGIYTTKGIINGQLRHNLFTKEDKWNFQGNWQLARYGQVDYGIGTGNRQYRSRGFNINEFPTANADSAFPVKYTYIRFFEKAYVKVAPNLFAGAGFNFNLYSRIDDEKKLNGYNTPHQRYSRRHDFNPLKYSLNGFLLALQYNTREHPIRSYGGIYADLNFFLNSTWLGSTQNSAQLFYDFRKYWSLSRRSPEHVIALWLWGSYNLSGDLPYLAMPSTASDTYVRSGRAYTFGRFKGPSYSYFETEYRFPILRNKLISGVCFFNMQSASDDLTKKVNSVWVPGGGLGLRILFQKQSRSTLCIDLAKGKYGSSGLFFGLNDVF